VVPPYERTVIREHVFMLFEEMQPWGHGLMLRTCGST
jgi:hypothetical protein